MGRRLRPSGEVQAGAERTAGASGSQGTAGFGDREWGEQGSGVKDKERSVPQEGKRVHSEGSLPGVEGRARIREIRRHEGPCSCFLPFKLSIRFQACFHWIYADWQKVLLLCSKVSTPASALCLMSRYTFLLHLRRFGP